MTPETTDISVNGDNIEWRNEEFMISFEEAEAIADEIRRRLYNEPIKGMLVDNRDASGTWPTEVTQLWGELMGELYEEELYCATVSPTATNAMQLNQLSEAEGTDDRVKAFTDYQEAVDFLDGNQ